MTKSMSHVPTDVALALVTGRRTDRTANATLFDYLLSSRIIGRPLSEDEMKSESIFEKVKRRAVLAFPDIAHETGAELDLERDNERRVFWLGERERRYGKEVRFYPERMAAEPL